MWTPAERIKYKTASGHWPTAQQASSSRWFSPVQLGPINLQQRTWIPAMVPWRATEDGFVTDDVLSWYERFAQGRPGGMVVEATGIRDIASGPLLRIGADRFIPGLKELVKVVREASAGQTRLFIQLIDFLTIRRRPDPIKYFNKYIQITDKHKKILGNESWGDAQVREHLAGLADCVHELVLEPDELDSLRKGYREQVTDLQLAHIRELPEVLPDFFAEAADRAMQAGFDGVELHYAHAYTMASFLSAKNNRNDAYGGSRENRLRLPLEVYQRVRDRVGCDFVVGCRFLSEECIEGGSTLEDAEYFGVAFAKAGMDFLSLSRGGKFEDAKQPKVGWTSYPYTGRSGYECMPGYISDKRGPFGRNVEAVSAIRQAIRATGQQTPVVVCGGIHGYAQAEAILARGDADIVAAARQSLADPDWFQKIRLGQGQQVHVCEYTNYCEGLDQKHKQVTCQLWDRQDLQAQDVKLSSNGKRRLTAPQWKNLAEQCD